MISLTNETCITVQNDTFKYDSKTPKRTRYNALMDFMVDSKN